jgi:hypothetical protein
MKNNMLTSVIGVLISLGVMSCALARTVSPHQTEPDRSPAKITLQECVDGSWDEDNLHRTIAPARGQAFPDRLALHAEGDAAHSLPMQLTDVQKYPDGSIQKANVWFRSDLPAGAKRTFQIESLAAASQSTNDTELTLQQNGNVWEIGNSLTAVRIPAGEWTAPVAGAAEIAAALTKRLGVNAATPETSFPGPLLGIKLASGLWAGASTIDPGTPDSNLLKYTTEILNKGPIFIRARVTYTFAHEGRYVFEIVVRRQDPLVRIDERYEKADQLNIDLATNLEPTEFATKKDMNGNMQRTAISYGQPGRLPDLVGWDIYTPDNTPVMAFLGGPREDLLAWVSTTADWLPEPYKQYFGLIPARGPKLTARGSLHSGHRHWGFLVGKDSQFPDPGKDLYRWWTKKVVVPLDKVANWQLEWPGMENIEFPHTFFSKADLPAIRARLQADPVIKEYMEALRGSYNGWGGMNSILRNEPEEEKPTSRNTGRSMSRAKASSRASATPPRRQSSSMIPFLWNS